MVEPPKSNGDRNSKGKECVHMNRYKIVYGSNQTDFATCYASSIESAKESVVANLPDARVLEWPKRSLCEYHRYVEKNPDKEHEFVKALLHAIVNCDREDEIVNYLENYGLV